MFVPAVRLAALLLLLFPCLLGCNPRMSSGLLPARAGVEVPPPAPTEPTVTPAPSATPSATPTPVPHLTASGAYDNLAVHTDGRYALQLAGTRVAASFTTARSPVEHWVRRTVPQPLFTIPEPFRPPRPVWRIVEGTPVHADGAPDPARSTPHRFLLRVDPDGTVHYVDDARVEGTGHLAYGLHTVWDIAPPPPTVTPTSRPWPTPTPTFVRAVPVPTPSLTVSGTYANGVEHVVGRYTLQLAGTRVAASFSTACFPVSYWAREVAAPLFTVPEPFRPPYPVLRTVEGRPVRADGAPDPDYPEPRRFLLRVDPDGAVHYVDDNHVEGVGHLAYSYSLDTVWGTTPAANDRAVLEILDRHWFGKAILFAEPPPVQFEVPAHAEIKRGTIPGAMVGAFVMFDADGRVTALGAPTNDSKARAGAPVYNFNGPLPPELGELHYLEHLDLGYQSHLAIDAKQRGSWGGPVALTGAIPPQLWRLPRLRHLDLQGQRLAGTLPSDIGHLANLEYLDLGNNWLSGSLPSSLEHLASLEYLDLGGNDFTEPLPSELGRLTRLERLDLNNSQLTKPLPPELGRLASLKYLDLHGNRLTVLPPELGQLASLERLDLGGNQLTVLPPELGQLASLQWLDLFHNQLTGSLPPEWGQLAHLQWLGLSRNQLTGSLPPEWGQLAHLQRLGLSYNQLTGSLPPEWGQLVHLQWLDLHGNQLTGSLPPEWGQLAHLENLGLSGNQLTGSLPPTWGQLTSLQGLNLSGNQLTGPLPPEWGQLTSLQGLDLSGNQLTGSPPPEWDQLAVNIFMLDLRDNQLTGCFLKGASEDNYIVHNLPNCPP